MKDKFEHLQRQYNDKCARLQKRRKELEEIIIASELSDETIKTVMTFAEAVNKGMREDEFEMKRLMLDVLKVEVTIRAEDYTVTSLLTGWSGKIIRRQGCISTILNPQDIPGFCRHLPIYNSVLEEHRWSSEQGKNL